MPINLCDALTHLPAPLTSPPSLPPSLHLTFQFRSDMGIERTNLGSLLDHTGAFGAGEKFQSYVFGSSRTYSGLAGGGRGEDKKDRTAFACPVGLTRTPLFLTYASSCTP